MTNDDIMNRALELIEQYVINGSAIKELRVRVDDPNTVFAVVAGESRVPIMRNVGETAFILQIEAAEAGQLHCVNELRDMLVDKLIGPIGKVIGHNTPDHYSCVIQTPGVTLDVGTEVYIK